ncbi:hypothetical protein HaLaN_15747 [Haematococcus lacustris]|uniref:Uncharacterized protein n=1 Tax=Haematococcus lacustris TaxID=44745 RepID=A0A699Z893_HAELA|nr:hypothetical protein HaLaN_15747 [Haematococcus lacustris]
MPSAWPWLYVLSRATSVCMPQQVRQPHSSGVGRGVGTSGLRQPSPTHRPFRRLPVMLPKPVNGSCPSRELGCSPDSKHQTPGWPPHFCDTATSDKVCGGGSVQAAAAAAARATATATATAAAKAGVFVSVTGDPWASNISSPVAPAAAAECDQTTATAAKACSTGGTASAQSEAVATAVATATASAFAAALSAVQGPCGCGKGGSSSPSTSPKAAPSPTTTAPTGTAAGASPLPPSPKIVSGGGGFPGFDPQFGRPGSSSGGTCIGMSKQLCCDNWDKKSNSCNNLGSSPSVSWRDKFTGQVCKCS